MVIIRLKFIWAVRQSHLQPASGRRATEILGAVTPKTLKNLRINH
jgi:hypothetical protein